MRQWVAGLLLAGLAAAPGLRVWCEVRCAADDPSPTAAARPHCHETAPTDAPFSVGTPDSCGDHATDPAVLTSATSRRVGMAPATVAFTVAPSAQVVVPKSPSVCVRRQQGGTSPPIPPGSGILRI